jgi:hypothetical protein
VSGGDPDKGCPSNKRQRAGNDAHCLPLPLSLIRSGRSLTDDAVSETLEAAAETAGDTAEAAADNVQAAQSASTAATIPFLSLIEAQRNVVGFGLELAGTHPKPGSARVFTTPAWR